MGGMKLPELDFLRLLPAFMKDDETAIALSKAMNKLMGEPSKRLNTLRTWDKIDELNETECDELAWELDIDWYDSTGMSLEEKRATIKLAQQIKRKRGTKWAVERLISAYFGEGYVMEWYDTAGIPYTFVALTTNTHITPENYAKFVVAVKSAKNVRSRIGGVFYFWPQGPDPGYEFALGSSLHRYELEKCLGTVGFVVKSGAIEIKPEVVSHKYIFEKCSETAPKPSTVLKDIITGKLYFLYVSAGKLYMEATDKKTTKEKIVIYDLTADKNYSLYVSSGRLYMAEITDEEVDVNDWIIFTDHMAEDEYLVFADSTRLWMESNNIDVELHTTAE